MDPITNRYEFVYLFDVTNGNPNGDPDAGNYPRVDPETHKGLVTDVCLKRKIRNYISITKSEEPSYKIYVQEKFILNDLHNKAHEAIKKDQKNNDNKSTEAQITKWMCNQYFDIRAFGAVMTTKINAGQVRGPVQLSFAQSIDRVIPSEITITRMAVTNEQDREKGKTNTMGKKYIIPYGLYRAHGFVSANLAQYTNFSEEDLELLWESLINMFEHDRSAARGEMVARKLIVFKHESRLGNAPAHELFERVQVTKSKPTNSSPIRNFDDYKVSVNKDKLAEQITIVEYL